jgi:hypothetical protein
VRELRAPYTLQYNSTNGARDGKPRKIKVEIVDQRADEKLTVSVRETFIPPKN